MEIYDLQQSSTLPEIAPQPKPKKGLKIFLYVLSVFIVGGLAFLWAMTCAWGGCPSELDTMPWILGAMALLLLIRIFKKNTFVSWLYWILWIISVTIMLGLFVIDSLPRDTRNTYVYGITLEACEVGKPAFPWGRLPATKDDCFNAVGECMKMSKYDRFCFDSTNHKVELLSLDQCEVFSQGKDECLRDVSVKDKNMDYCQKLDGEVLDLYNCVEDTSGINGLVQKGEYSVPEYFEDALYAYQYSKAGGETNQGTRKYQEDSVTYGIEYCSDKYSGDKRDVCLYKVVMRADRYDAQRACDLISLDWLRASCTRFEGAKLK